MTTPPTEAASPPSTSRKVSPWYGQIIVGPPGSGKTTYCAGMQQYLRLLGRNAWVINLDPANEGYTDADEQQKGSSNTPSLPYETLVDIRTDLVDLGSVQEQLDLGPNGALLYCMEYLEAHMDEFIAIIEQRAAAEEQKQHQDGPDKSDMASFYLLLDCPGQVELFTHNDCIPRVIQLITKRLNLRLAAIQLIDSQYITDASKFLSAALVSTMTLIRLELPMVSVLSKVDLLSTMGNDALPLSLDFFTDCPDMTKLLPLLEEGRSLEDGGTAANDYNEATYADDPDYQRARAKVRHSAFYRRYYKMHQALAEVVDDYALLNFVPCDIQSAESVGRVLARIDQSIGFVASSPGSVMTQEELFQCAVQAESSVSKYETITDIQERMSMQPAERQTDNET